MSQKDVEFVHEVLGDQVGPSHHIERVGEDWAVHLITNGVEIIKNLLVDFHYDDLLSNIIHVDGNWIIFMVLLGRSCSQEKNHLVFHFFLWWCICRKSDHVTQVQSEKVHAEASFVKEFLDGLSVI